MNNADGKVIIDTSLNTKKFEKQIEKTEEELKHLEHLYDSALKSKGQFKESEEAIRNLGVEIEKTANKLSHLKDSNLKQFSNSIKNIEFNPQKSLNCQARAVAVYVSLRKQGLLEEALKNKESFLEIVYGQKEENIPSYGDVKQLNMLDKL